MRIAHVAKLVAVAAVFSAVVVQPVNAYTATPYDTTVSKRTNRDNGWCTQFTKRVAPAAGQQKKWTVSGTYCEPWRHNGAADVLTHGATYTRSYWDWPQQPGTYSYVNKTLAAGRVVVAYDRIGNGASTRPLSTEITMATDAYVLHQLIQELKQYGFKKINSVSHSYGSGVAIAEAATYKDVNKVVLTGYLHAASNPAVSATMYPAIQDPAFANKGIDAEYLTTKPNTRGASFHATTTDPKIVAYDEAHKDLVSRTGFLDFLGQRNVPVADNLSNKITVPILSLTGEKDAIFCHDPAVLNCSDTAAVTAKEAPYYAKSMALKVAVVKGSGHDLTLHPTANDSFRQIDAWLKK